ncbi:hypothetical protein [Streptomyces sp. CA-106110]|uniref:hypothetical protein n=1 Tax=Streptomyces sp. CA-106110 TaxID=3240044 RepID=UPI003D8E4095
MYKIERTASRRRATPVGRDRVVAACAIVMSTIGITGAVSAGPASAAPGACAPGHRAYRIVTNGGEVIGSVGLNIAACPNQPVHLWSVTKGEERAGFVGGLILRDVDAFVDRGPGGDTDTERWFNTRILLNICPPGLGDWADELCAKDAEWSVRYHLVNAGGEVTLDQAILDPAPQDAGLNQNQYHLTWD